MTIEKGNLVTMSPQAQDVQNRILDSGGRRLVESMPGPNGGALDFYTLGGRIIIVQEHADNHGIEVYLNHVGNSMKSLYVDLEKIAKG